MEDDSAKKNKKPWNYVGKKAFRCDICGKEFYRLASKTGENKFCSRECYLESKRRQTGENHPLYQRTEVTCVLCGKTTHKSTYRFNRAKHHFCSVECKRKWPNNDIIGTAKRRRMRMNLTVRDFNNQQWNDAKKHFNFCCAYCCK